MKWPAPDGRRFARLTEEDFLPLAELAQAEGVKPATAYRWLHDHGYVPHCRRVLSGGRHRLIVPLLAAEAYAAARGCFPVAATRPPGWLGVKQAAQRLGCSPGLVHYRARQGQLRAVRCARRVYFEVPHS